MVASYLSTALNVDVMAEIRAVASGQVLPSLNLVGALERRLSFLEKENERLQIELAYSRPKKARSPGEWRFRVTSYEWVEMQIFPREFPAGKRIRALRLHVPPEDVSSGPAFWDITRKREIAVLEPLLPLLVGTGRYVHMLQEGEGVKSGYVIHLEPV